VLLKSLCIATCALILTACQSSGTLSPEPTTIPANLATPCPKLQPPSDGTSAAVLKWIVEAIRESGECRSRHQRLVEAWPKPSQP
jgi:hypothetical protein